MSACSGNTSLPMQETGQTTDASSLLSTLLQKYVEQNPKSALANKRAVKVMPAGSTRAVFVYLPFPLTMVSGEGCHLTSIDGDKYLDFVSEYFAGMFGHSHPAIKAAVEEATSHGFNLGAPNTKEVELAEAITSRFPSMDMIQFCNSGTEANTLAIAVGLNYTRRKKILVFEPGYHGTTLSFKTPNALILPHQFVYAPYNDVESTRRALSPDIGVILVEPMLGAGGLVPGTHDFLSFLRSEASRIGAILVFDEVVTARTHYSGLQGFHNIVPDMTVIGKFFGGGMTFGAYGGRREIMDTLDTRSGHGLVHSGTWHNNILSMTAGVVATQLLSEANISKANALGDQLRRRLGEVLSSMAPERVLVRGFGSLVGVHFLGPRSEDLLATFYFHMVSKGIYMGHRGFLCLSIVHEQEHIDAAINAAEGFVTLIQDGRDV